MKPNLFIFYPDCPEDFFSRLLAYIANLFPAIGQRLVQRIAVLAGRVPDYFGVFERCEFWARNSQMVIPFPDLTSRFCAVMARFILRTNSSHRSASTKCKDMPASPVEIPNVA